VKIHSDIITATDIASAATHASSITRANSENTGVYRYAMVRTTRCEPKGSRKRARAFDVILTGSNTRGQQHDPRTPAATYDEWGHFLAHLFAIDPKMVTPYYADAADFHTKTANCYHMTATEV